MESLISDPTVIPILIVSLIVVTIAIFMRLYKTTVLVVIGCMVYVGIIIFKGSQSRQTPPIQETRNFSSVSTFNKDTIQATANNDIVLTDTLTTEKSRNESLKEKPVDHLSNSSPETTVTDQEIIQSNQEDTTEINGTIKKRILLNNLTTCRTVENREPVGIDTVFVIESDSQVVCYTQVENSLDSTEVVTHYWTHNGRLHAKIDINVPVNPNWRCWSKIRISPDRFGKWKATVVNSQGEILGMQSFRIRRAGS